MDVTMPRATLEPIQAHYGSDARAACLTLKARGAGSDPTVTLRGETGREPALAGTRPKGGDTAQVVVRKGGLATEAAMAMRLMRIPALTVLLLAGCHQDQVKQTPAWQNQQIESPLQNTVEGMAKAREPEQARHAAQRL